MQTFGRQIGMREKDRGIWRSYSWRQCYEHVREFALGLAAAGLVCAAPGKAVSDVMTHTRTILFVIAICSHVRLKPDTTYRS